MDYSVNTRPLLQQSESESDFEDDILEVNQCSDHQNDHVIVTKDLRPLLKLREPSDRYIEICFIKHSVLTIYSGVGCINYSF
jgi:hypothetical protein